MCHNEKEDCPNWIGYCGYTLYANSRIGYVFDLPLDRCFRILVYKCGIKDVIKRCSMGIKKFRISWYIIFTLALIMALVPAVQPVPIIAASYNVTIYSSTSDGDFPNSAATYNTVWTDADCTPDSITTLVVGQLVSGNYYIYRTFVLFDTSSIPVAATITAASLNLYVGTDISTTDYLITVQNGQPTYPHDPVVDGDYDKSHYSGDGGNLTTVGLTVNAYNTITLNTEGISSITKGGTTKLFLRSSRDIAGTAPTGDEYVIFWSADTHVGAEYHKPYLYIEYTTPSMPSVAVLDATNITSTSARIWGNITDDGGASCEARFRHAKVIKYDNFEWGNDGDNIDISGGGITWTKSVAGTSTAKISIDQYVSGTRSLEFYRDGTNSPLAYFSQVAGTGYVIRFWVRKGDTERIDFHHGNGTKRIYLQYHTDENVYYYDTSSQYAGFSIPANTWGLLEIKNINWTAGTYDIYYNGVLKKSGAIMNSSSSFTNLIGFYHTAGSAYVYIDDVEVTEDWTVTAWQNSLVTNSTYYKDLSSLISATQYEYQAQAKNSAGEGNWSGSEYFITLLINIGNTPVTYGFGILEANTTANTTINYFTITNTGTCVIDITIQGTDMIGGGFTWVLSDNATAGNMIYGLKAGLDDADDTFDVIVKKTSPYNLVSGLGVNATQGWGLKIWSPTSYDDGNPKTGNITLSASMAS